jgi:hypothetical protein
MTTPNPSPGTHARFGFAIAVALPLAAYLCTLSGASYWLDAGEFVAAAVNLDIAHPPGHPLSALYGKLWTLVPLGSLPFRFALGQAFAAALASGFLYRACLTTVRAYGVRADEVAVPAALLGAWLPSLSFAIWFQAVRPEVYALQGLLSMLAIERLVHLHAREASGARPLYGAAFALGLGLTNHHLSAFLLFPALLLCTPIAVRRARSLWPIPIAALFGLLALSVYAYLPVRAAQNPPANLGVPVTLERMYWVVSARVYARDFGSENPQPLAERFADIGVELVDNLQLPFVIAALAGLYAALRSRGSRRVGWFWLLVAAGVLGVRGWLGPVRGNPDSLGYLYAGFAAFGALAGLTAAALGDAAGPRIRLAGGVPALIWTCALLAAAAQLSLHGRRADLFVFHATDTLDEHRLRRLPPRAALIATTPQTVFRHLEMAASEAVRPDVALVPLPFLRYPGVAEAVVRAHPDTRALIDDFLARDRLRATQLLRLGARRSLLVELDAHVAPDAYRVLLPVGLLHGIVHPKMVAGALPQALAQQRRVLASIALDLGKGAAEVETARQLLWVRYMDAVYHAAAGRFGRARDALADAAALRPRDAHVRALRAALAGPSRPMDVRPFLAALQRKRLR